VGSIILTKQATPPWAMSLSSDSGYYDVRFLEEVADELKRKAFIVKSGLASLSKADQFAYEVLSRHGFFSGD
jgi:hypothetical protein